MMTSVRAEEASARLWWLDPFRDILILILAGLLVWALVSRSLEPSQILIAQSAQHAAEANATSVSLRADALARQLVARPTPTCIPYRGMGVSYC
jgi:hypothetical protein